MFYLPKASLSQGSRPCQGLLQLLAIACTLH